MRSKKHCVDRKQFIGIDVHLFRIAGLSTDTHLQGDQFNTALAGMVCRT